MFLDENCTCFVRDGKTYCKKDYVRLFGTKCDKCGCAFGKNDYVMRANKKIFHLECFRCVACERQLIPGDSFALKDEGLYCNEHHKVCDKSEDGGENNNNKNILNNNSNNSEDGDDKSEEGKTKKNITSFIDLLQSLCQNIAGKQCQQNWCGRAGGLDVFQKYQIEKYLFILPSPSLTVLTRIF